MTTSKLVEVRGSHKHPLSSAQSLGPANPQERAEVAVLLRWPAGPTVPAASGKDRTPPLYIEALEAQDGAAAADVQAVATFAKSHGLAVVRASTGQRKVVLAGSFALMDRDLDLPEQGGELARHSSVIQARMAPVVSSIERFRSEGQDREADSGHLYLALTMTLTDPCWNPPTGPA